MLHIVNGSETTRLIEASGIGGRTISWADSLYDGPVPDVSDAELVRVRARFHAQSDSQFDANVAGFTEWRRAVDDADSYDELVLWFEHDLFDQLNLIHILSHLGDRRVLLKPVTLISTDRHPSKPDFRGFGELAPIDLAVLYEARRAIHEAQIVTARRAWAAFRSADPRAIETLLSTDLSALPFLAAALRRHLEEFPSEVNGLSKYEARILELAQEHLDIKQIFRRVHEGERWYYLTDSSLADRIREFVMASPPLLVESNRGALSLTPEGRDVLSGDADRVRLCGIDRWLGGVHLKGHGPVWRLSNSDTAIRSIRLG